MAEGKLTWEQFWLAPEEVDGGHRLLNAAMKAQGTQLAETLRTFEEDEPGSPESRHGPRGRR